MSRLVVVHHALHHDEGEEGVYRLMYAQEHNHDQDRVEGSAPLKIHADHQEIVWCAGDPKWEGRDPEDIAAEQIRIVRDALTQRAAQQERAEAEAEQRVAHLGTKGQQL